MLGLGGDSNSQTCKLTREPANVLPCQDMTVAAEIFGETLVRRHAKLILGKMIDAGHPKALLRPLAVGRGFQGRLTIQQSERNGHYAGSTSLTLISFERILMVTEFVSENSTSRSSSHVSLGTTWNVKNISVCPAFPGENRHLFK